MAGRAPSSRARPVLQCADSHRTGECFYHLGLPSRGERFGDDPIMRAGAGSRCLRRGCDCDPARPRRCLSATYHAPALREAPGVDSRFHPGATAALGAHLTDCGEYRAGFANDVDATHQRPSRPSTCQQRGIVLAYVASAKLGRIKALEGHAEESQTLDFKKELGKSHEIAKDLAALALGGGVLIYGATEDKASAVDDEIIPFPLKQVEERFQQISGSAIAPPLDIEVELLRVQPGDAEGVAVVVVPPSPMAPHQVNHRYPVRRGTMGTPLARRRRHDSSVIDARPNRSATSRYAASSAARCGWRTAPWRSIVLASGPPRRLPLATQRRSYCDAHRRR